MLASFTDHTLPILANWSQFLGILTLVTLLTAMWGFYMHHRCSRCRRLGRYKVGEHQVPTCHRHRKVEQATFERPS